MEWVRDGKADRASIRLKASSGGNKRLTKEHVSEWEEVEQDGGPEWSHTTRRMRRDIRQ